ncbi:hypothetical protein PP175_28290 (plasmid) [Aneurinibacillus sp. Ricciae_BoGa-3]|uniref:hypothetical protein n=1 Tax=Aneurinibacillus sp. Ricciae_BoGa-3 TaxID=3022697 RepID=UPI002342055A|nr:hypothetical protein [Aneurinibacillus sp. Ricciae_BoGa-3]WCK57091.1 hypothetical protein PP175_28290 [Aneurinibacillus sp. Ricciae_BoGa-3]
MSEWESFGYLTDEPCEVCGKVGDNRQEPRFLYTVCEKHQDVPPTEVARIRNMQEKSTK